MSCARCPKKTAYIGARFCGAACTALWEAGDKGKGHVCDWVRTGPDTLFCYPCQTELDEPEDK